MSKRTFILASAAAAAILCAPRATFADQPDWTQYKESFNVKFSGYAGTTTLTNFPALMRLSAERNGFDYTKCADGADLRFSDADGNLIPHEIDTWNAGGESLVWVQVPELTKTTIIKAYYGYKGAAGTLPAVTATDVWTNGYVAVWHMSAAEGTFTQRDSTTTGKNIAAHPSYRAGILCGVEGAVGAAAELGRDGATTGAFYVTDRDGVLDGFPAMTLEVWSYQAAYNSDADSMLINKLVPSPATNAYNFYQRKNTGGQIAAYFYKTDGGNGDIWQGSGAVPQLNEWTHQVARWNGSSGRRTAFINGVSVYNSTKDAAKGVGRHAGPSSAFYVGNNLADQWGVKIFHGKLDEIRISSVARSDAWVVASHDTIANADFAFYDVPNDWKKYAHKFNISFPGATNGVVENFPVLVKISETSPVGFRYADCLKANGGDLRFADENGTLLPCEIEVWNPEGESLIWVKVPTLTSTTRITAYYGWAFAPNVVATDVWDENFVAVWHMDAESDSLVQRDATANKRNVSLDAGYADNIVRGTNGVVGAAADFGHRADGKGNYGRTNTDGAFDGFTTATFEFWTKQEAATPNNSAYIIYSGQASPTVNGYMMYQSNNGNTAAAYQKDVDGSSTYLWGGSAATPWNTWNHHAFRYDGVNGTVSYIQNNVSKHAPAATDANKYNIVAVKKDFCIGSFTTIYTANANYIGTLDEMRISNVARSDAWVKATHDTIAENATFTRYGVAGDNTNGTVIFFK